MESNKKMAMANLSVLAASLMIAGCDINVIEVKSDGDQSSRSLVAAIEQARKMPKPVVIELDDGIYRLERPIELTAADSQMEIRAKHRGKAVISGMRRLEDVRPTADGKVWTANLPGTEPIPDWYGGFGQRKSEKLAYSFFQAGHRLTPARYPKSGFARVGWAVEPSKGIFAFQSERLAKWAKEPDLWVHGLWQHEWADLKSRILKIDTANGHMQYDKQGSFATCGNKSKFYVFNARCEVSEAGDMYLDRGRRELTFIPVAGGGEVEHSYVQRLVTGKGLRGVRFNGLVFEGSQHHAMFFSDCENVSIVASTIRRTSACGIEFKKSSRCRVVGCDLYDLGEGGIDMEGGDKMTLVRGDNVIDNCHIHHYGQVFYNYKVGIHLRGCGNRATHNLIHHSDHSAIHFDGNDHYIGWNVMHDIMIHNHDAGTIYCCMRDWMKRGTVIEHNLMHAAGETDRTAFCVGIYLDDYSSGDIVRYNIVSRHHTGIYFGGGQDNQAYCNLVMSSVNGLSLGSRGAETGWCDEDRKGRKSKYFTILDRHASVVTSELWRSRYPYLYKLFQTEPKDCVQAHDARWNVFTNNVCAYAGMRPLLDNWKNVEKYTTMDRNLYVESDPGLVDYAGGDFEIREGTPAWQTIGGSLRFAEMGLYESPDRASAAMKFGEDMAKIAPLARPPSRPAVSRIDIAIFPTKDIDPVKTPLVRDCLGCEIPKWAAGKRINAEFGRVTEDEWRECRFCFTPNFDLDAEFDIMGARGGKTLYDGFEVEGFELKNADFEQDGVWTKVSERLVPEFQKKFPTSDYTKPWGIFKGAFHGVKPFAGEAMMIAHDPFWAHQPIKLKKGVRVSVKFRARACPTVADPAATR